MSMWVRSQQGKASPCISQALKTLVEKLGLSRIVKAYFTSGGRELLSQCKRGKIRCSVTGQLALRWHRTILTYDSSIHSIPEVYSNGLFILVLSNTTGA